MTIEIAVKRTPDGDSRQELSRFNVPAIASDRRTAPINSLRCLRVVFAVDGINQMLTRLITLGCDGGRADTSIAPLAVSGMRGTETSAADSFGAFGPARR